MINKELFNLTQILLIHFFSDRAKILQKVNYVRMS